MHNHKQGAKMKTGYIKFANRSKRNKVEILSREFSNYDDCYMIEVKLLSSAGFGYDVGYTMYINEKDLQSN